MVEASSTRGGKQCADATRSWSMQSKRIAVLVWQVDLELSSTPLEFISISQSRLPAPATGIGMLGFEIWDLGIGIWDLGFKN